MEIGEVGGGACAVAGIGAGDVVKFVEEFRDAAEGEGSAVAGRIER